MTKLTPYSSPIKLIDIYIPLACSLGLFKGSCRRERMKDQLWPTILLLSSSWMTSIKWHYTKAHGNVSMRDHDSPLCFGWVDLHQKTLIIIEVFWIGILRVSCKERGETLLECHVPLNTLLASYFICNNMRVKFIFQIQGKRGDILSYQRATSCLKPQNFLCIPQTGSIN